MIAFLATDAGLAADLIAAFLLPFVIAAITGCCDDDRGQS